MSPHYNDDHIQPTMPGGESGDIRVAAPFNPENHLSYTPPAKVLSMEDLCLPPSPISPVGTTEPFPLLSDEAILEHRREIFAPETMDHCMHYTRPGSVQVRGMAPRYAPFIHNFWHSDEVLRIMSDLAGVELVPAMDYECGHTNVQLDTDDQIPVKEKLAAVRRTPMKPPEDVIDQSNRAEWENGNTESTPSMIDDGKAIVEWHRDSHPWVCVVMLSDARQMTGGETVLMKGDGSTIKVRAPQMVGSCQRSYLLKSHFEYDIDLSFRAGLFSFRAGISPTRLLRP